MMYDPITGEPIQEEASVTQENQTVGEAKSVASNVVSKKWFLPALIGGSVSVVAVVAVVVMVLSGAFLTPVQKVSYAVGNTFKDAGAVGDLLSKTIAVSANNKNTTHFMMEVQGQAMEMEFRRDGKDKQVWVKTDISGYPDLEGTIALTKKELQAKVPILGDHVFVYDYTADNEGALMEQVPEQAVIMVNKMLAQIYKGAPEMDSEALREMTVALQEWMEEIEIEEVEKEEFEINGRDVSCPGYEIVIDEGIVKDYVKIILDGMKEYMEELGLDEIEGYNDDIFDDAYEEAVSELRGMSDIIFTVYTDSNMLAAVYMEVEDEEGKLKVLFEGGDYRAQNITIKVDSQKVFQFKGETDGNEENGEWIVYSVYDDEDKHTVLEYEYDKKSGDFEVVFLGTDGNEKMFLEGNIICNSNGVELTDAEFSFDGQSLEFEFSCKKGVTMDKLNGDRFDIGNADEDDFEDLMEDLQDELEDFIYPEDGTYFPEYDTEFYY